MLKAVRVAWQAVSVLVLFTVVLGAIYPTLVTGLSQALFPRQANGSLVIVDERVVGSALIGQEFSQPDYFWGRPSATVPFAYNASRSGGSNLGPTNPELLNAVQERIAALRAVDRDNDLPIPVDLVTTSGSGLDPDISVAAAFYQVERVAAERGLAVEVVRGLVERHVVGKALGVLGEARVNVLELNLDLDELSQPGRTVTPMTRAEE